MGPPGFSPGAAEQPLLDLHALPERDVPRNLLRRRFRLRIKPRRSRVPLPIHFKIVVTRRPLPRTHRVQITRLEIFLVNRLRRKILIPFDLNRPIALGQNRAVPHSFCHIKIGFVPPRSVAIKSSPTFARRERAICTTHERKRPTPHTESPLTTRMGRARVHSGRKPRKFHAALAAGGRPLSAKPHETNY